jgi:Ca-activated chloride channel family protein
MVAEFVTAAIVIIVIGAEAIHLLRVNKLAPLAFGPKARPAIWAMLTPVYRVLAIGLICWGLISLLMVKPKTHNIAEIEVAKQRHMILLVDVSPSMRLKDAGPETEQSRSLRSRDVVQSFFDRVPIRHYKVTVIAFYNKAIPVVIDTNDLEIVKNCMNELPMWFAFEGKETDLFAGLESAAEVAKPWQPDSTILVVLSDGDTVSSTGMPKMPRSIADVLVVGVGDPVTGKFLAGGNSRQDASTLRQVATRLQGEYHNGNSTHLSSKMIAKLTSKTERTRWEDLTRREYALIAITIGSLILGFLPLALHYLGTSWYPGSKRISSQDQAVLSR